MSKLALISMISAFLSLTPLASADVSGDLTLYFHALEGHWDGQGTYSQPIFDGHSNSHVTSYRADLQIERVDSATWNTTSAVVTDSGISSQNTVTYALSGDFLRVNTAGVVDPVHIVEASPSSLTYQMRRVDVFTGQIYDFTFQTVIDPSGRSLSGHTTIELNRVIITDEPYTARRW